MNSNNQTLPFELSIRPLDGQGKTERVLCRGLLRQLANNREVYVASWGERDVIVKVFYKRVTGRYRVRKEWNGFNLLRNRGINAPQPLFYGRTEEGNWAIVTERIANSHTLDEIFNKAVRKEKIEIIKMFCTELARQHEKGVVQKDLHLGNFLQDGEKLVVLDPAQMRFSNHPVEKGESISQLALITSNIAGTEGVKEIWEEYFNHRGWQLEEPDERLLEAKTAMYKRKGLKRGLKKTLRTSKRFVRTSKDENLGVFDREFIAGIEPIGFMKHIDELMEAGEIIKREDAIYASSFTYNGKKVVVERYGRRGFMDLLCQTITGSWAKKFWLLGHRSRQLGQRAPKPLAYIERRKKLLIWKSYFINEQLDIMKRRTF